MTTKVAKSRRAAAKVSADLDHTTDPASPAVHTPKETSSTVWVACKLPKGIVMQLTESIETEQKVLGGGIRMVKQHMRVGGQVRLKGYAVPFGKVPNYSIIGDFGLTEVDRRFWEKWKDQNSQFTPLVEGLIFAYSDQASAAARAREHEKVMCGLEPMNPDGDVRAEQPNHMNLTDIEPDTDRSKDRVA
jgi:hypothetical protein